MKQLMIIFITTILTVSCAHITETQVNLNEKYPNSRFDRNIGVYYNILPFFVDFTIKNISHVRASKFETTIICRRQDGVISYDYQLGRIAIDSHKSFESYLTYVDCSTVTLIYSFVEESLPDYKHNNNDKGKYAPLASPAIRSGEILLKISDE